MSNEASFAFTCRLCGRCGQLARDLLVHGKRSTQNWLVLHLASTGHRHTHGISLSTGLHTHTVKDTKASLNLKWQNKGFELHRKTDFLHDPGSCCQCWRLEELLTNENGIFTRISGSNTRQLYYKYQPGAACMYKPVRAASADTVGWVAEPLASETTSAMTGFIFDESWGWVGASVHERIEQLTP